MGMDSVEIFKAVEESFDIQIEDCEAENLRTPKDLIELILCKTCTTSTGICLTHRSFNLLRRFLVERCALQRGSVRPDVPLHTMLARDQRCERLQQLTAELALSSMPQLVRSDRLISLLCLMASLAGLVTALCWKPSIFPAWVPTLGAVIATGWIGAAITRGHRTTFPSEYATVGQLARWIMTHKSDLAIPLSPGWTRDQISARVREIVVRTLGCESEYAENARFVEDLGVG